jgi:hypothetical protein
MMPKEHATAAIADTPDPMLKRFLENEGSDIEIIDSQVEPDEKYNYQLYGSDKQKRNQRFNLLKIESWLSMPYIFDELNDEHDRWARLGEAEKKYGESVRAFLRENRIDSNQLEYLITSMENLLRNYIHLNPENFVNAEKAHSLLKNIKAVMHKYRKIVTAHSTIEGTVDEVRQKLLADPLFTTNEIKEIQKTQKSNHIPPKVINEKILEVMRQLEMFALKVLEMYKRT